MENSKAQQGIIRLGKLLVSQLGLQNSADTLGRWMAHYIAEKMIAAEKATGKAKDEAEKAGESPWLIAAHQTDQAAKVCLEYLLKEAAAESATAETAEYLEAAKALFDGPDTTVISALLDKQDYGYDIDTRKFKKGDFDADYRKTYLQKRIDYLDVFSRQVNLIKTALEAELKSKPKSIRKAKPKTD